MRPNHKDVTRAEARKTALLVGGVLGLLTAYFWWRARMTAAAVAGSLAALLGIFGLFIPPLAKLFHRGWMTFAYALGYVNSRIILTLFYFLVVVPYGLISRLFGRDPLQLRQRDLESYWTPRSATRQSKEQFERLF
jgi:hypothetical protein